MHNEQRLRVEHTTKHHVLSVQMRRGGTCDKELGIKRFFIPHLTPVCVRARIRLRVTTVNHNTPLPADPANRTALQNSRRRSGLRRCSDCPFHLPTNHDTLTESTFIKSPPCIINPFITLRGSSVAQNATGGTLSSYIPSASSTRDTLPCRTVYS